MTDWNDLLQYICSQYRVINLEPHWIGVELAFESGAVRIKVERVTAFAAPFVLVIASICSERHIDAMAALRYNAVIALGSLVVENQRCYLRAALPLDELGLPALDRAIDFIAREALKLRGDRRRESEVTRELFGNFDE